VKQQTNDESEKATMKRTSLGQKIKAVRAGLAKGLPQGTKSLKVGDTVYTVPELDAAFGSYDDICDAVLAGHAALEKLLVTRTQASPGARELLADFKTAIVALLGRKSETLLDFGINPVRPRKRSGKKTAPEAKPTTTP